MSPPRLKLFSGFPHPEDKGSILSKAYEGPHGRVPPTPPSYFAFRSFCLSYMSCLQAPLPASPCTRPQDGRTCLYLPVNASQHSSAQMSLPQHLSFRWLVSSAFYSVRILCVSFLVLTTVQFYIICLIMWLICLFNSSVSSVMVVTVPLFIHCCVPSTQHPADDWYIGVE